MPVYNYQGHTVTSDRDLSPDEIRQAFSHVGVSIPGAPSSGTGATLLRGATSALPIMGGVLGGMAGSEVPVAGTIAGVGGGSMLGESLRQLINHAMLGDQQNPMGSVTSGLVNAAGAGALEGLPAAGAALSPTSIAEDIAKGGTLASAIPGMVRRAARSLVPGEGPLLTRPAWQAAEAPPDDALSALDRFMPNAGGQASTTGKVYGNPYPLPVRGQEPPGLHGAPESPTTPAAPGMAPRLVKGGSAPTLADALTEAAGAAREPMPTQATFNRPGVTQTPAGKPSVTAQEYDQVSSGGRGGGYNAARTGQPPQAQTTYSQRAAVPADNTAPAATPAGTAIPAPGSSKQQITDQLGGELDRLRRTYGADRIAGLVNPNAPEPVVGAIVKATGQPSAMPDLAQQALLESLKNPSSVKNPGNFMRALSQVLREYKRNGGAAQSDTAKQVADTLRKYGFDINDETGAITPETAVASGAVGGGIVYGLYKLLKANTPDLSKANHTYNPFQRVSDTLNGTSGKP